jgi:hypothetical protein
MYAHSYTPPYSKAVAQEGNRCLFTATDFRTASRIHYVALLVGEIMRLEDGLFIISTLCDGNAIEQGKIQAADRDWEGLFGAVRGMVWFLNRMIRFKLENGPG